MLSINVTVEGKGYTPTGFAIDNKVIEKENRRKERDNLKTLEVQCQIKPHAPSNNHRDRRHKNGVCRHLPMIKFMVWCMLSLIACVMGVRSLFKIGSRIKPIKGFEILALWLRALMLSTANCVQKAINVMMVTRKATMTHCGSWGSSFFSSCSCMGFS